MVLYMKDVFNRFLVFFVHHQTKILLINTISERSSY